MVKIHWSDHEYDKNLQNYDKMGTCRTCNGSGLIYEFYNDPVTWKPCKDCAKK